MFFQFSKVFWLVAAPGNLLALLLTLGAIGLFTRFQRTARAAVVVSALGFLLLGFGPFSAALIRPLEDRFARPAEPLAAPTGIIILGGGLKPTISRARGSLDVQEAGSRMIEAAALAQRFPQARVVFTGGIGVLDQNVATEVEIARLMLPAMGIAPERIVYEDRSRNTHENALFTREMLKPGEGETWLLVTSSWLMASSVGVFRSAVFPVVPYPVDYTTFSGAGDFGAGFDLVDGMTRASRAIREYIGLVAYRLSGRTKALFPAP
jgi:uncharacterized SAM-binding protein YcdF (DUF218 family)